MSFLDCAKCGSPDVYTVDGRLVCKMCGYKNPHRHIESERGDIKVFTMKEPRQGWEKQYGDFMGKAPII